MQRLFLHSATARSTVRFAQNSLLARWISVVRAEPQGRNVNIQYSDGSTTAIGTKWLRDHAHEDIHPKSKQRMVDTYSIPSDIPVKTATITENGKKLSLQFPDRNVTYEASWLHSNGPGCSTSPASSLFREDVTIWQSDALDRFPAISTDFSRAMDGDAGRKEVLTSLWRYGIAVVRHCPLSMHENQQFAERLGIIKHTLFGGMWSTRPQSDGFTKQEYSDTASTNDALLPHTDGNYWSDPPGLQLFTCVQQSIHGGESVYVDGYRLVQQVGHVTPEGYSETLLSFFSRLPLRYYLVDQAQGYHHEATGTVFRRDLRGRVCQVRFNDYDRSPLSHLCNDDVTAFYAYHRVLCDAIRDPNNQLEIKLKPGDMTVIDNHRVLHARKAFKGERCMIGCYIGKDDIDSAYRVHLGRNYE